VLWSAGALIAGLGYRRLAAPLGQRRVMWGAVAVFCGGIALLIAARVLALTLTAALLMGTSGAIMLVGTSAILSERHGDARGRVLVEANALAVMMAVATPLLFGGLAGTAATWRAALLVPFAGFMLLFLLFGRLPLPSGGIAPEQGAARLPLGYWVCATLVALAVAIEFCVVFYAAQLLHAAGLPVDRAASMLTFFYVGELAGRLSGAALTRGAAAWRGPRALTAASLAVAVAGFLVFWQTGRSAVALAGLFVTGLGIANLYPLTLGLTMAAAPDESGRAAARVQVLVGIAAMGAPFLLSVLADRWGVARAFVVEPVLIVTAAVLLACSRRYRSGH
jgi:MFS family permease